MVSFSPPLFLTHSWCAASFLAQSRPRFSRQSVNPLGQLLSSPVLLPFLWWGRSATTCRPLKAAIVNFPFISQIRLKMLFISDSIDQATSDKAETFFPAVHIPGNRVLWLVFSTESKARRFLTVGSLLFPPHRSPPFCSLVSSHI